MKIARIFEHSGRFYVCAEAAGRLDTSRGSFATKAAAMRGAKLQGYTHAIGSGTYLGNSRVTDLAQPFDAEAREAARRSALRRQTHTQLDLDAVE